MTSQIDDLVQSKFKSAAESMDKNLTAETLFPRVSWRDRIRGFLYGIRWRLTPRKYRSRIYAGFDYGARDYTVVVPISAEELAKNNAWWSKGPDKNNPMTWAEFHARLLEEKLAAGASREGSQPPGTARVPPVPAPRRTA